MHRKNHPHIPIGQGKIPRVREDAILHIRNNQRKNGSFLSLSSPDAKNFSKAYVCSTTFFTSIILSCLNAVAQSPAISQSSRTNVDGIRDRAARFLMEEKNPQGSWNYWSRTSDERKTMPYPDDLDDTFAALVALHGYRPEYVDGRTFASVVKLLTALEIREGGPYRTWLVDPLSNPQWLGTDIVGNSTAGYFLSLTGIKLPNLETFIGDKIQNGNIASAYYPGLHQVIYFVSRYYRGQEKGTLAQSLPTHYENQRTRMNPLEIAMMVSSLTNLGETARIPTDATKRLAAIMRNGNWKPYAFCIDPKRDGVAYCAGASTLTAALCLEASVKIRIPQVVTPREISDVTKNTATHERIRSLARESCLTIGRNLKKVAVREIDGTDDEKITAVAYDFYEAIKNPGNAISPDVLEKLSLGNLYGWISYRIHDDFLDGEGDPLRLPCAHLFLRRLVSIFADLQATMPKSQSVLESVMNITDDANTWEQENCRIPQERRNFLPETLPCFEDYENLGNRSFGHALGTLIQVVLLGHDPDSEEYESVASLFRHYLIARQMHDDAHDWTDDLMHGRITGVSALILRRFAEKSVPKGKKVDLRETMPILQKVFWTETIDDVTGIIRSHIDMARKSRERSTLLKGSSFMETVLAHLEKSAQNTLRERNATLAFLENYGSEKSYNSEF